MTIFNSQLLVNILHDAVNTNISLKVYTFYYGTVIMNSRIHRKLKINRDHKILRHREIEREREREREKQRDTQRVIAGKS